MSEAIEHRDIRQTYSAGEFVTWCACGMPCPGADPDDADFVWLEHRDAAQRRHGNPTTAPAEVTQWWTEAHTLDRDDALSGASPAEIAAAYLEGTTCGCCGVDLAE